MEFGVFILAQQRSYEQTSKYVLDCAVQQTVAAEAAGFNTAWYAEHHFNNYSLSPSPLMLVTYCAAVTKTIRLGTAVCVLPLYHPNRLLGEIGFADAMSEGRLELGVGSGYQQFEFERFGVKLEEAPALFGEHLDIIQKGLRERIFSHDGPHLTIPSTAISVRTVQRPSPPIWLAAGSARSMRRAYSEGHNVFVTVLHGGCEAIGALRSTIEEAAAAVGRKPEDSKIGFLRCAFASDDDVEITAYLENARYSRRLSESLQQRRQQSDDGYLLKEQPSPNDLPLETLRANLPVGSVNRVIDRLLEEIEILKPNQIAIQTQLGNLDQTMMLRQIDLWGEKIIPALHRALGSDTPSRMALTATAAQ
jgi:alkanesulfonate monooxygenase SsuD/methylene tetrahydromethanopterin reductase-like flavin-dependent oxidoreductase (luciferase family)